MNYYILGRRRRGNLTTTKTVFVEKSTGITIEEDERSKSRPWKGAGVVEQKGKKFGPGAGKIKQGSTPGWHEVGNRKTGTAQIKKRA